MVLLLLVVRGAFCLCAHWLVRGKPWLAVRVIAWEELGNKEEGGQHQGLGGQDQHLGGQR